MVFCDYRTKGMMNVVCHQKNHLQVKNLDFETQAGYCDGLIKL